MKAVSFSLDPPVGKLLFKLFHPVLIRNVGVESCIIVTGPFEKRLLHGNHHAVSSSCIGIEPFFAYMTCFICFAEIVE